MIQFSETSEQLCKRVAAESGGTCLLAFSCGKDSIAAYLQCRKYFKRIVPYYLYLVPGLQFVEKSLRYYEREFDFKICRMPHPSLYRMLNNFTFQAPQNIQAIKKAKLPTFDYQDVYRILREDFKLDAACPVANGVRACDSPIRRVAVSKRGAYTNGVFMAVFDWNKARVIETIQAAGVKLPSENRHFGRSFDGLDYRFLAGIKLHYPADFQRILDWFPLAEVAIKRQEFREAHHALHK